MSQRTGSGVQNTDWHRNPSTGFSESRSILGIKKRPQALILPKGYTDRDFGDLLSSVVESPELLASDAIVNVLPAKALAQNIASNSRRSSTKSQVATSFEDLTAGSGRWSSDNEAPPVETVSMFTLSTKPDIREDNGRGASTPPESVVGDPTEDTVTPATVEYEIAEDKRLLKLMSSVTPLELVIGAKQNEMCIACFHVGHHHTDFDTCPTARISSLFSRKGPYYNRLPEKTKARVLLMKDIGWACQGLSWAIQSVCQGYLKEFQIFPGTVSQLHKLLHKWKSVVQDEKFTFGGFIESGSAGELTFGEPIRIAPAQSTLDPSEKVYLRKRFTGPETLGGEKAEIGSNFLNINALMIPKTLKQKTECDADRLQLPVLGNRPAAICTNCLHRGHAKSSIKICPYLVVSLAIEKLKAGKKRQDNVSNEIECLEKVVNKMTGPSERERVEPIILLIAEWKEAAANFSSKGPPGKKIRAISSKNPQGQVTGSPFINSQAHGPSAVLPNGPPQTLDLGDSDHLPFAPFYGPDYVSGFSNPLSKFSKPLISPFDESGTSSFYDLSLGSGCFAPPTPKEHQHPGDFQHTGDFQHPRDFQYENNEFSPGTDPFLSLEIEPGISELPDEEGIQDLFDNDSGLSMWDSFSSLPTNASCSLDQSNNDNSISAIIQTNSRDRPGDIVSYEQDWGQPSQSQSTYVSALSSQQNSNPPSHESNQANSEYNFVDELPAEIWWRTRCPLKLVGNRSDSFCKICLHYGHDKRSQSCLVNVVRIAIAGNKLQGVLEVSETIKDLEAGVKWQRNLPEEMQGDDNMILNLIRRWKETAESLRKAEIDTKIDIDFRDSKRRRPSEVLHVPARQQQAPRQAATTQMDHEIEHFTPSSSRSHEGQFSQAHQPQSPRRIAPANHQMQNWIHTPALSQQRSFQPPPPPPPTQQIFSQQPYQNQSFVQQQEAVVVPRGWAIDYSRMDSDLFTKISDYIISDGDPADSDNLRVDNQKMPPMLIVAIRKFVIPESLLQKAPAPQPVVHHQQQDYQPQMLTSTHLQDIGQHYQDQIQTPKRKRN